MEIHPSLKTKLVFYSKYFATAKPSEALKTLILFSDYACRHVNLLHQLIQEDYQTELTLSDYAFLLQHLVHQSFAEFARNLREFRHYHLLRLLLRELADLASTESVMQEWSACADAIILSALQYCEEELKKRYGCPCNAQGKPTQLYTLAMGKLGGRELNFSSDIDLIFTFSEGGYTIGEEQISNQQFYTKVVQLFVQLLNTTTAEGFVFRVDLRLRPNGESGALVSSLAAMEIYYQEQGRDWERYAMVKARLIGENSQSHFHWFHHLITPFVYRRYVDFSVIESLRSMKSMIERELQADPKENDIKRGLGGIREIEFIVQNMQLIRGGRLPILRTQNTIAALISLKREKLLSHTDVLKQAYLFLRKLENMLQSQNDQQTHVLPHNEMQQAQIALAMQCKNWDVLLKKLQQYQRIVTAVFRAVLARSDSNEDQKRLLSKQLLSLWQGHVEKSLAVNLLASIGYQEADRCYQMINSFRHSPRCRRLSQAARIRLDRFMLLLLHELGAFRQTDAILAQVLQLLEQIVGRSSYLALITENSSILSELLYWFAKSPFVTRLLVNYPFLLEALLDRKPNWQILSKLELKKKLETQLSQQSECEQQEEILRQFKLINWFLAARAEVYGHYRAIQISHFLAGVAEVIVSKVVTIACSQLEARYPCIRAIKKQFAIIAYGKLGSREMSYESDLDLVFIHTVKPEEETLVIRLSQKILHMLTTRLQAGILFAVDTRLRPSGEAGLLVSHRDTFLDYQLHHAWIWEHQALIRARLLFGNQEYRRSFIQLKKRVFQQIRNNNLVRDEVLKMRQRIFKYSTGNKIKYAAGGLIDLEFLVQFLVLTHPDKTLYRYTNTLDLLNLLYTKNSITKKDYDKLVRAYEVYHQLLHNNLLNPGPYEIQLEQKQIQEITKRIFSTIPS